MNHKIANLIAGGTMLCISVGLCIFLGSFWRTVEPPHGWMWLPCLMENGLLVSLATVTAVLGLNIILDRSEDAPPN